MSDKKPRKIRTDTKKYIAAAESQEEADWQTVLEYCAPAREYCAGDRLIVPGYVCLHCQSESPQRKCLEPMSKLLQDRADRAAHLKDVRL